MSRRSAPRRPAGAAPDRRSRPATRTHSLPLPALASARLRRVAGAECESAAPRPEARAFSWWQWAALGRAEVCAMSPRWFARYVGGLLSFEVGVEVAREHFGSGWLTIAAGVGERRRGWLAELVELDS